MKSQSKGLHLVYRIDDPPEGLTCFSFKHGNTFGDFIHANKLCILWDFEGWLAVLEHRAFVEPVSRRRIQDFENIKDLPIEGERHETLVKSIVRARNDRQIDRAQAVAREAGLPEDEIQEIYTWAMKKRDRGNRPAQDQHARLFIENHGFDFLYNVDLERWLKWDGQHWMNNALIWHEVRDLIKDLLPIGLRRTAYISDVQKLLRDRKHFRRLDKEFDSDDSVLNCPGCEIDLATGISTLNKRESYCTMMAGACPDELMPTPRWDRFLQDFTASDQSMIDLIYKILFQSLLGNNNCQRFFILSGCAGAGKSTLTAVLKHIAGDYSISVNSDVLTNPKAHQTATYALKDCRFGSLPELTGSIHVSKLKALTGCDEISARALYSDPDPFRPKITMLSSTNSLPKLGTVDSAIRDRIIILPSTSRNFRKELGRVSDLEEVLFGEASGILGKTLGYRRAFESDRFFDDLPSRVTKATLEYFDDEDHVGRWLSQNVSEDDTATTRLSDLIGDFESWCLDERVDGQQSLSSFSKALKTNFPGQCRRVRTTDGRVTVYSGLRLANQPEEF